MAISDVTIANRALTKLGKPRITSFADPGPVPVVFAEQYTVLRDTLQRLGWNFTRAYATLSPLDDPPPFQFTTAYPLPADYLRLEVAGAAFPPGPTTGSSTAPSFLQAPGMNFGDYVNAAESMDYQIVGQQIWTNIVAPLSIVYHRRVTDPNQFDTYFVEAFAAFLALELCETVTGSSAKYDRLAMSYQNALAIARKFKSIENPPVRIPDDTFIMSRVRGS